MKTTGLINCLALLALLSTLDPQLSAAPLGTAFTYQGRLADSGQPAHGSYDLKFALFDTNTGGTSLAGPVTNAVGVSNGLFTVTLDFGSAFDGNARWLEIGVRTNGGGAFSTLAGRQPVTPSPYAITAVNVTGFVSASQLTGTLPSTNLGGTYSGVVTFINAGSSFAGNGSGLTTLDANGLASGTVPDARLSTNVSLLGQRIESNEIADGTILDVNISPAANISGSKVEFHQASAQAVARSVEGRLRDGVSVKDFGATGDGVHDDLASFQRAFDFLDTIGGGILQLPQGKYRITGQLNIGNGSDEAQSSKHHGIRIVGQSAGVGPDVSSVHRDGATTILYDGPVDTQSAVISFEGPIHNVGVEHVHLDCHGKAGTGLRINHVAHGQFSHVVVVGFTALAYDFTSRRNYSPGVTYGNSENDCNFLSCYNPSNAVASGMRWTSGVATTNTLTKNPDTCRCHFRGGTLIYGGGQGSYGLQVHGADNNTMVGTMMYASGGQQGGSGILFTVWGSGPTPPTPYFPLENVFINVVAPQGYVGDGGIGGNLVLALPETDGTQVPLGENIHTMTHAGKAYVGGKRTYRQRQTQSAGLLDTIRGTADANWRPIPSLQTVLSRTKEGARVRAYFSGRFKKFTAGTGDVCLNINGANYGQTYMTVEYPDRFTQLSTVLDVELPAGNYTIQVFFRTSDSNILQVDNASLVAEELY